MANGLLSYLESTLSILRMDHFAYQLNVNRPFLRVRLKDAMQLVGEDHSICDEVPLEVPYVGHSLSIFKPGVALL